LESAQQKESGRDENQITSGTGHIRGLNGLRALAVLLVLFRHTFHLYFQQIDPQTLSALDWIKPLFTNGWIGVDLFFVLSGFLISRPFFSEGRKMPSLKTYAMKRVLRIVPAYYVVLFLIVLGLFPFYNIDTDNLGWRTAYHMLFMQDYLDPDINTVFWSLGVEEKFYFLIPLMFLALPFLKSDKAKSGLFIAIILLTPFLRWLSYEAAGGVDAYYDFFRTVRAPFHCCLEPLFLGVLIAQCEKKGWKPFCPKWTLRLSALALFTVMVSHEMMDVIGLYDVILQPLLISCLMAGLVYGVVMGERSRVLENKCGDFFARTSYSLYLLHWPLFPLAFIMTQVWAGDDANAYTVFGLFALTYCGFSILAATIQYHVIERPFLSLKSKLR